jgi:hypothetical protein
VTRSKREEKEERSKALPTSLEIEAVEPVHDLVVSDDVRSGNRGSIRSIRVPGLDDKVLLL